MILAASSQVHGPHIDWAAFSPIIALLTGAIVVLLIGLLRARVVREHVVPAAALVVLGAALGLSIWRWNDPESIISGALRVDNFGLFLSFVFIGAAAGAVILGWRSDAPREASHGEWFGLILASVGGMVVLVEATNLVTVFLGLELLSIPLYILCATELRRETSLESGLKYLIVGSVGSATFLYGLAFIYGASGSTDFTGIAGALNGDVLNDSLFLTGMAFVVAGLAFKASVAPFHQWTPDVYEGAPTAITTFMATATKAAALGITIRFFDVALIDAQPNWAPALAFLAAVTIIVGNVGALGQSSVKRILAWSSVAQAGYMLAGIVVSTRLGVEATLFYLMVYLAMNVAAFAVVVARERETGLGDDITALNGIGFSRPLLAWPMTISMLALAGIPATAGFIGKFNLIEAAVDGDYTWLGVFIVIGSMISLAYYLRVVVAVWSGAPEAETEADAERAPVPVMAGGSQALDEAAAPRKGGWEVYGLAVAAGAASLGLGIVPQPLLDLARDASAALTGLL